MQTHTHTHTHTHMQTHTWMNKYTNDIKLNWTLFFSALACISQSQSTNKLNFCTGASGKKCVQAILCSSSPDPHPWRGKSLNPKAIPHSNIPRETLDKRPRNLLLLILCWCIYYKVTNKRTLYPLVKWELKSSVANHVSFKTMPSFKSPELWL
jgi:hypothetical protein